MKKFKFCKKWILLTPIAGAIILTLPTMVSCGLFSTKLPASASSLHKFMNASSQIEWISKRSMSLKFVSETNSVGYGTGWIFAKNPTKDFSYYIATNLHVASFIQNQEKSFYSSDDGKNYSKSTGLAYPKIEIGIVGKKSLNNTFVQGTSESLMSYDNGGFHYVGYLPTSSVRIAYAGHQAFPKSGQKYQDPYKIRNNYINNGAVDIALIECDFSRFISNSGYQQDIIPNFLSNYDANPTVFAQSAGEHYNKLYIAGFPYANSILNPNDPILGAPKYPIWVGLSDVLITGKASGISLKIDKPNISGVDPTYSNVAITNEIPFVDQGYSSYRNVALQGLVDGVDIGGGSSGSMVVNENNEVVGIYWGTYTLGNGSAGTKVVGGIDYLYSDTPYSIPIDLVKYPCHSYNLIEDIQNYLGKENLQKPIWK